jgi:hypothetical protein
MNDGNHMWWAVAMVVIVLLFIMAINSGMII